MGDVCETGVSHIHGCLMFVSSSEAYMIAIVRKLAEENPDEVEIIKEPQDNYGCIYAKIPFKYLKISAPKKRVLSEEEKQIRAERLRKFRFQKKS